MENLSLPITVLRCDYQKKNHAEYMFTIFHRLNTGGTKLNNQEIRNCIYSGSFNDFLKEMASGSDIPTVVSRYTDEWEFFLAVLSKGVYSKDQA